MDDGTPVWQLKRQDDHGNQYTVDIFDSEEEARKMMEYYERKGHKQTYWVEISGDYRNNRIDRHSDQSHPIWTDDAIN